MKMTELSTNSGLIDIILLLLAWNISNFFSIVSTACFNLFQCTPWKYPKISCFMVFFKGIYKENIGVK